MGEAIRTSEAKTRRNATSLLLNELGLITSIPTQLALPRQRFGSHSSNAYPRISCSNGIILLKPSSRCNTHKIATKSQSPGKALDEDDFRTSS